ncbi:MCE family protein [Nocardiaceae bacterium YC2-7]|uniref:MCE family protein n=2 Tax=Antrihabitans stalactiti TaxID=2584121 RepID=A0A848K6A5_9NOCA|nr:MCE family protein [Antrihabitans stalactiti]
MDRPTRHCRRCRRSRIRAVDFHVETIRSLRSVEPERTCRSDPRSDHSVRRTRAESERRRHRHRKCAVGASHRTGRPHRRDPADDRSSPMKPSSALSLSAIATVFVVGSAYLTFDVVHVDWFKNYTTATMTLPNSGGLVPRSPVLLSGLRVGEVTTVENTETGVEVAFRVSDDYRIPVASEVSIEILSALGEPYVEFKPVRDDGRFLENGQHIDTAAIQVPLSIPEMARTVTDLLGQLDPDAVSSIVDTFTQALSGTASVVPTLARSTSLLAATLLSRTPQINSALIDMQTIASDMEWVGPSLTDAAPTWTEMGRLIDKVVAAFAELARTPGMPDSYTEGTGLLPFLQSLSAWIDRVGPDLAPLVPVLQPLAAEAETSLGRIDLSALIAQALDATGDSALHLYVNVN